MKLDSLGLNHWLFFSATVQTVRPRSSALSSGHFKIAPPHSSSCNPRCRAYQAASCVWSDLDLKKTPLIPVTLAMEDSLALHAARGEPRHQVLLQVEEQQHHRDRHDDRPGREVAPLLLEAAHEEPQAHRGGVHVLLVHEGRRLDELVPAGHEREER